MNYIFRYNVKASDLWKLSMYQIYHSMVGFCNIIFTAAMFFLLFRFGGTAGIGSVIVMVFALSLFPVIQPILLYLRAGKQLAEMPKDMEISFDEKGVHISSEKSTEDYNWNQIKKIVLDKQMIAIYTGNHQGFMLFNHILGEQKNVFFEYLNTMRKSMV